MVHSEVREPIPSQESEETQRPPSDLPSPSGETVEGTSDASLSEEHLPSDHPRRAIRQYLRQLFALLGEELPAEWPLVTPAVYNGAARLLRERLDQLYDFLQAQPTLTADLPWFSRFWRKLRGQKDAPESLSLDQKLMPRYLGETALYLLQLDYQQPESWHLAPPSLIEQLSDRPAAIIEFDQLYCSPDSTHRRVERILRDFGSEDARILFLGDDDLGSVALSSRFAGEIHMIDLDDRLHEYIEHKAPSVRRHKADFVLRGISGELCESFDAVVLDPPWDFFRLWCFLDKAIFCLKQDPHARIYLCYCPLILEHRQQQMAAFQQRLASRGLTFESIETAFNLYSLSSVDLPDFQKRLDPLLPPIASPLLDFLRKIPYAHAQLYVLRRISHFSMNRLKHRFFLWWNRA